MSALQGSQLPQVVDAALVQMKINDLPENSISDVDDIEVNAQ